MKAIRYVLVVAVSVGSVFGVDSGLLDLAPPDAQMAAGIHVDRTRNTPFGQFMLAQMQAEDPNFRAFTTATGFDPRRDLNEVVIVSNGSGSPSTRKGLLLARGLFNGPQIFAAAKAHGGASSLYKGVELLRKSGEDRGAIAVIDGAIAIAGDEAAVKGAIDRRRSPAAMNPQLLAKIRELSAAYDAWFVSTGFAGRIGKAIPNPNIQGVLKSNALQAIEQTSGGVKFGSTVQVAGEAVTRSAQDAQALVDVARFLAGILTLNRDQNPEAAKLAEAASSLNVQARGTTVQMSLAIAEADLEQLLQAKQGLRRAALR